MEHVLHQENISLKIQKLATELLSCVSHYRQKQWTGSISYNPPVFITWYLIENRTFDKTLKLRHWNYSVLYYTEYVVRNAECKGVTPPLKIIFYKSRKKIKAVWAPSFSGFSNCCPPETRSASAWSPQVERVYISLYSFPVSLFCCFSKINYGFWSTFCFVTLSYQPNKVAITKFWFILLYFSIFYEQ